jgi:hypothetical protein
MFSNMTSSQGPGFTTLSLKKSGDEFQQEEFSQVTVMVTFLSFAIAFELRD